MNNFTFDEEHHEYKIDGRVYPSVTTILTGCQLTGMETDSPMLKEKIINAGKFGRAVHTVTELYDRGTLDMNTVDEPLIPYLDAWKLFRKECSFTPTEIEARAYHHIYKVPGTIDRIGELFGKMAIVDIKSSAKMPVCLGLQTAAYLGIWNDYTFLLSILHGISKLSLKTRYGVLLKPDSRYELKQCKNPNDWNLFLSALAIYNWRMNNLPKPIKKKLPGFGKDKNGN